MASEDALLLRSMRGFSREKGNPLEEPALRSQAASEIEQVEGGESLDELRSRYDELRSDDLRPEYRGFKVPAGMDEGQSEDWFASIDSSEDERESLEREAEAKREAESGFGTQLLGSLERTVMKDNPRMGAKAVEGLGRVAGSQAMVDFGLKTAAEFDTSDDPASFSPRIESIYDAEGFQDYIDYAGSTLGQGLGSMGAMVAGAGVAGVAGAPFGAAPITAPVGAVSTGFLQNYGEMYGTLVDQQGVDPDAAAKYALVPAAAMAAVDTVGLGKILKPAKDALSKIFVTRIAQLSLRGGAIESTTEGIQSIIQESAGEIAELTGMATKDIELGQRAEN